MATSANPLEINSETPVLKQMFDAHGLNTGSTPLETGSDVADQDGQGEALSDCALNFGQDSSWSNRFKEVQSLLDSRDFKGAAESLLNMNMDALPLSFVDKYADLMEYTADHLDENAGYILFEMAGRQNMITHLKDTLNVFLDTSAEFPSSLSALGDNAPMFSDTSFGSLIEMFSAEGPQANTDTGVLSAYMASQGRAMVMESLGNSNSALMQNIFALDLGNQPAPMPVMYAAPAPRPPSMMF